jgi:hypothetical protein
VIIQWLSPEELAVRIIILSKIIVTKREAICWVREKEAKVARGVWLWWTDRSRTEDGKVGAEAVWKHRDGWKSFHSHLGSGRMEVHHGELSAFRLALWESVKKRYILQANGVTKVAVFSNSHAAI